MIKAKRLLGVVTCGVAVCAAGPALAARLASGSSGTGAGGTGWMVSVNPSGSKAGLYPGGAPVRLGFSASEQGGAGGGRAEVVPSLSVDPATGDVVNRSGQPVAGCLARWFRVRLDASDSPLPAKPGTSYRGFVDVTMIDAPVNQDACEGQAPAVTVTVS